MAAMSVLIYFVFRSVRFGSVFRLFLMGSGNSGLHFKRAPDESQQGLVPFVSSVKSVKCTEQHLDS